MKLLLTSVLVLCWTMMSQSLDHTAGVTCNTKSIDGFCSSMNYTFFATPNFRNGTEESEIETELQTYAILYSSGCSNALVHFLCAYYKPPCFSTNAGAIRLIPCRELCLYVRSSCEPVLKEFRATATWPDHLDCDQFPLKCDENGPICYPGFHALEDYQTRLMLPRIPGAPFPSEVTAAECFWSPGLEEPTKVCTSGCRRGCGCPLGTVLDEEANACVNVTDCPKEQPTTASPQPPNTTDDTGNCISYACKVQGQEYFEGGNSCVPCTGTCEKPTKVCTSGCCRGCGCPLGTVLDEEANACVNVTDCPKEPSCPQECSHSFCQQNGANAECSVPAGSTTAPTCTGTCHVTKCRACYYSKSVQTCPNSCKYRCGKDPGAVCFKKWSQCVRRGLRQTRKKKAAQFKCVDPCDC